MKFVGEPGTGEPLDLLGAKTSMGEPFEGWLVNKSRKVVGRVSEFKPDFAHFEPPSDLPMGPPVEAEFRPKRRFTNALDRRFLYQGEWSTVDGFLRVASARSEDQRVSIASDAARVDLHFHSHQWSGLGRLSVKDGPSIEVDLISDEGASRRLVRIDNPVAGRAMSILVVPLGTRNTRSNDCQLIVEGMMEHLVEKQLPTYAKAGA
ncbi:hypothetical protein [Variovorax sp. OV329]|uniref:hypothetical protein n=1 Tax=Variovorax sp. OV329 TaxID=1882825 RepID=UPI0011142F46|nr:hypothetical protein [Variovorax sp. OV329]